MDTKSTRDSKLIAKKVIRSFVTIMPYDLACETRIILRHTRDIIQKHKFWFNYVCTTTFWYGCSWKLSSDVYSSSVYVCCVGFIFLRPTYKICPLSYTMGGLLMVPFIKIPITGFLASRALEVLLWSSDIVVNILFWF